MINQYVAILGVSTSVGKVTSGAPQGDYVVKLITNLCSKLYSGYYEKGFYQIEIILNYC